MLSHRHTIAAVVDIFFSFRAASTSSRSRRLSNAYYSFSQRCRISSPLNVTRGLDITVTREISLRRKSHYYGDGRVASHDARRERSKSGEPDRDSSCSFLVRFTCSPTTIMSSTNSAPGLAAGQRKVEGVRADKDTRGRAEGYNCRGQN